jgi:hypothetical protein
VIEFEDGQEKVEGKGRIGFELFMESEEDLSFTHTGDLGSVEEASGDYVEDLAGLGAEDASEVGGLVAGECGSCGGPGIGDPAAARH